MSGRRTIVFILILLQALVFAGCKPNPTEDYIQGTWVFANEFGDERSTSVHLLNEWWFGGGRFHFQQEVAMGFPDIAEGRYRIFDSTEDQIILELFHVEGNAAIYENQQLTLRLEREADGLRVGRTLYYRSGP